MTPAMLAELSHLCDVELAPLDTWPPQHAPAVDVEGVIAERKRALELIEAGETEAA